MEEPHFYSAIPPLPVGKVLVQTSSSEHLSNQQWQYYLRGACVSSVNEAIAQKVWEPISVLKVIYYFFP